MLYKTFLLASIASLLAVFTLPPSHSAKWQYHLVAGKKYSYHFKYESKANSGADDGSSGPNSDMDQTVDADISVTVKSIDKKSNTTLLVQATNIKESVVKHGDWTPVRLSILPESEITIDLYGTMVSGKILQDDTGRKSGKQPLTEEQALDRTLHQVIYRQLALDTFYDGFTWHDTIPKEPPHPRGVPPHPMMPSTSHQTVPGAPPPDLPLHTVISNSVSAGTPSNPRVVWTLTTDVNTHGTQHGKDYSDVTHGLYSFDEATGMISGYSTVTETHRGSDYYKTTKELTLKY